MPRVKEPSPGPESAREGPPWSAFPEPVAIVLLHLEHRERGMLHIPMSDAAYERISRHGPTWDGKPVGTRALVLAADVPRWNPACILYRRVRFCTSPLHHPDGTEHPSEKEQSTFVQRWRARLKRIHSSHG